MFQKMLPADLSVPSLQRRSRRRRIGVAALAIAALVLVGCQGRTTGASHFNSANNTIRLNALGSCDTSCTAYLRYRVLGTSQWTNTPTISVNSQVTNVPWSQTVSVSPGVKYEYQVCGKESSHSGYSCAGPDGTPGTTEVFTAGPLQARTGAATNVYAFESTLTGEIEWTQSGAVTWWFQHGRTTSYGSFTPASNENLSANVAKSVSARIGTSPSTIYHYRLCVINRPNATPGEPGAVCGGDRTLKSNPIGTTVTCGQTITASTVMGNNLMNCPDDGLIIGAPNITLDLNGHRIFGDQIQIEDLFCEGPGAGPDYGVDNSAGHDGVAIINGTVGAFDHGFNQGIWLNDADNSTLRNLIVTDHFCEGIAMRAVDRAQVDHNLVSNNKVRNIGVDFGSNNVIQSNTVEGGGKHSGIQLYNTSSTRVEHNVVSDVEFGIEVIFGSPNNRVIANTVDRPNINGIALAFGADDTVVDGNTVSNMTAADPDPGDPGQFAAIDIIAGSSRNQITNNRLLDNRAPGIAVGLPLSISQGPSVANTVAGNTSVRSASDGIIIGTLATNTVVRQNTANGNGDDGIDVDVASTTITANIARNNADRGIEAVAGVTDGGGNRASGNGNAGQCLNVACSP